MITGLLLLATAQGPDLVDFQQLRIQEFKKLQSIRDDIRRKDPKAGQFPPALIQSDTVKAMGLNTPEGLPGLQEALTYRPERQYLDGFKEVDFGSGDPVLSLVAIRVNKNGDPNFLTMKKAYAGEQLYLYRVKVTFTPTAQADSSIKGRSEEQYLGPMPHEDLVRQLNFLETHPQQNVPLTIKAQEDPSEKIPAKLYDNQLGDVAVVLERPPSKILLLPDNPQLALFKSTPEIMENFYQHRGAPNQHMPDLVPVSFAIGGDGKLIDLEHLRREKLVAIQSAGKHLKSVTTPDGGFAPELLNSNVVKNEGLQFPRDQNVLYRALTYRPEGNIELTGFHPIDYGKDKAASYSTPSFESAVKVQFRTLKDAFQGKQLLVAHLRVKPTIPDPKEPNKYRETYVGPITRQDLDLLIKKDSTLAVEEIKQDDVPVDLYTDAEGSIVFVFSQKPKKSLLIPYPPGIKVFTQSPAELNNIFDEKNANVPKPPPFEQITFAIPRSMLGG